MSKILNATLCVIFTQAKVPKLRLLPKKKNTVLLAFSKKNMISIRMKLNSNKVSQYRFVNPSPFRFGLRKMQF